MSCNYAGRIKTSRTRALPASWLTNWIFNHQTTVFIFYADSKWVELNLSAALTSPRCTTRMFVHVHVRTWRHQIMIDFKNYGIVEFLFESFDEADIYLRLSFVSLGVLCVLCCFICCAWRHYRSVISSVLEPQR